MARASRSIFLGVLIAPQSALITGSLTPSVIGGRPSHPIYRVERTSSRAGVAPAGVQRLSRRTVTPINRVICHNGEGSEAPEIFWAEDAFKPWLWWSVSDSKRNHHQSRGYIFGWGIVIARFDVDSVAGVTDLYGESNADVATKHA